MVDKRLDFDIARARQIRNDRLLDLSPFDLARSTDSMALEVAKD